MSVGRSTSLWEGQQVVRDAVTLSGGGDVIREAATPQ